MLDLITAIKPAALLLAFICVVPCVAGSPRDDVQPVACNQASDKPVTYLDLPGRPFEPVATTDGCWILVSTMRDNAIGDHARAQPGIAVVRRSEGKLALKRILPIAEMLTGMTLTHDGKLLIAGTGDGVLFLDSAQLISGRGDPILGRIRTSSEKPSASYVNTTADDGFLFVSNESSGTISVINLNLAKQSGFSSQALIGTVPVGRAPIAVTLSPDGRYLYTTSELAPRSYGWPAACQVEGANRDSGSLQRPEGAIIVVDVDRAKTDPANSALTKIPAGCSPVRLVLSPKGDRAYVTARSDNALLIFDAAKLLSDPQHARLASVAVGEAPVGVAVVDDGRKVIVANSNRFSHNEKKQYLSVIDSREGANSAAVVGAIPAGVFPREIRVTADGRTLLVTNFASKSLEVVDLNRQPIKPDSERSH